MDDAEDSEAESSLEETATGATAHQHSKESKDAVAIPPLPAPGQEAEELMSLHPLRSLRKMSLICKENLIHMYTKAGFQLIGKSHIVHGKDPWFDMDWTI